jgi:hypothetical protein
MKPATEQDIIKQLTRDLKADRWNFVASRHKLFVSEMQMDYSRADLMLMTKSCHLGFEVKSGRDRLDKLAHQIPAYELFCDRCWLVLDPKHGVPELPYHWGIMLANTQEDGSVALQVLKDASANPMEWTDRTKKIADYLWSDEVKAALRHLKKRGYSKNNKWQNVRWLCQSPNRVRPLVYEIIKARGDWRAKRREGGNFKR